MKSVSIVIPTYKPDKCLKVLLERLQIQDYHIDEVIIINTDEKYFDDSLLDDIESDFEARIKIIHIEPEEFNHGRTRNYGMSIANAEYVMFMTQDAMPKDRHLISELIKAFEDEKVFVSYARQLPRKSCDIIEKYTREFNYPSYDIVKSVNTLEKYGIKNYFCSDVCSMYRHDKFKELGGFPDNMIFNEDMIYAYKVIKNGGEIYYSANAKVIHSHNYSCMEQLRRNFDNGVSQAMYPEVFEGVPSEGEGIKMIKNTAHKLLNDGYWYKLPQLVVKSGFKYIGFKLGKSYRLLSKDKIKFFTSNKRYWNNMEEEQC